MNNQSEAKALKYIQPGAISYHPICNADATYGVSHRTNRCGL